jgi:hypothetical protein
MKKPDLNEALEVLLACIKGRMIRGTGEYPGPTKIKAALAALSNAVVLDAETWRTAHALLGDAADMLDEDEAPTLLPLIRDFLAAHPLEEKP